MKRTWIIVAVALALVAAAYGNSLDNPFHFDDSHSIADNAWVRSLAHIPRYFTDVTVFSPLAENRSYRPFLLTGYAISHALGGGAAWGYHVVTMLLHALGAALVGLIGLRLFAAEHVRDKQAFIAAVLATAVFAVHPLLSEPVNYASARSSLQAAVLMLATFWFYIEGRERGRSGWFVASAVAMLLAMGTKIFAMTMPALLIAWEVLLGPSRRNLTADAAKVWLVRLGPAVLIAVGFTLLHEAMVGGTVRGARSLISPASYFLTETQVWLRYVGLFVWPEDLCADLVMRWSQAWWEGPAARALIVNAVIIVSALVTARRWPIVALGIGWFYVTLSPTNSIVPLSEPATEHRVYVAVPGLVWAFSYAGIVLLRRQVWSRRMVAVGVVVALALVGALGARTHFRNRVWASDEALWRDVVAQSPTNGRAHLNYGLALMARGDLAGADQALDRCLQHWPRYTFCFINRAVLRLKQRRQAEAEVAIRQAEALNANNVYVRLWRGEVEVGAERWSSAEAAYRATLEIAPGHRGALRGLARSLFEQANFEAAAPLLHDLERAGELDPHGWFALGYMAQKAKDTTTAAKHYERALAISGGHVKSRYNLAVIHHGAGRLDEAIAQYQMLAQAPDARPEVLDNLVRAHWAKKDMANARASRAELQRRFPAYAGLRSLTF